MHLNLKVKRYHEFFWLRSIRAVNIYRCCAECFIGRRYSEVYHGTKYKANVEIDMEIEKDPKAQAYYLCGLSAGFNWYENTHIAFVPTLGETVEVDNKNIHLTIMDARRVEFADYKPNPIGFFTQKQRTCRNWIFANYLNDGMLKGEIENGTK